VCVSASGGRHGPKRVAGRFRNHYYGGNLPAISAFTPKMAASGRNRWQVLSVMGGRHGAKQVAGLARNTHLDTDHELYIRSMSFYE